MPPKNKTIYICSECGFESPKWYGKCPACGEWNTLNEEVRTAVKAPAATTAAGGARRLQRIGDIDPQAEQRQSTGMK